MKIYKNKIMKTDIKECKIDNDGTFKYIQISCINKNDSKDSKLIIRGTSYFSYHKQIFDDFLTEIKNSKNKSLIDDYEFKCIGGGRIEINGKMIFIYGYSTVFGQADHAKTVQILKKYYPYKNIDYSNGGY